jgi:hypothetical protein
MRTELPQAQIPTQLVQTQFASVASAMRCAKDTHVVACAAASLAGDFYPGTPVVGLGTKNIRDVGIRKLARLGIEVQRPHAFFLERVQQGTAAVASALGATLRSAPTSRRLLERPAADGAAITAALHDTWQQSALRL